MGLDIYLYRYDKKPKMSDDGECNGQSVELDSEIHPKHMFKIGYFRSSYNGGGINSILRDRVDEDLYSILGVDGNEYVQRPDWNAVLANTERVIAEFREAVTKNPFSVMDVGQNIFGDPNTLPKSGKEALAIAQKTLVEQKHASPFGTGFTDRNGFWDTAGLKVYGIVPGVNTLLGRPVPTSYVIVKHESENGEEPFKWYLDALEVVRETAQWVLKQKNPEKYYLHVSG